MAELTNKLLQRQIRKFLKGTELDENTFQSFFAAIESTYQMYEEDREMIERSMELSSTELNEANDNLKKETDFQKNILIKLKNALTSFKGDLSESDKSQRQVEELDTEGMLDLLIETKEAAEYTAKLKEQFLSNMSHELRTPMNGVIGMTHLLMNTGLSEEQMEYISTIKYSADNMMVIINDVLDFAKIESGKLSLEATEFNVEEILQGILMTLKVKAKETGLRLAKEIDIDIPPVLIGDPVRLNQILLNLANNAIKFTSSGSVRLVARIVEDQSEVVYLEFSVVDTGIGIAPERQEAIFESFSQASNDITRKFGGTGLGLAISRELVDLMGGQMKVESELGKGSRFYFTIPLKRDLKVKESKAAKTGQSLDIPEFTEAIEVLLIEDNKVNQKVAIRLLQKWNPNLNIDIADHGKIGLEKYKKNDYDIILMDLQMPEMDGFTTTQHIRGDFDSPKKDIPIIAITANAMKKDQERVYAVGMDDFLSKPFVPELLYQKVYKFVHEKVKG